MIRAVEHMAIAAKDTAALARWYRDTLGFRVVVEGGQGIWFVGPPEGEALVEIVPATQAQRVERERNDPGWSHLAFSVTDFDATCEALKAKGITFNDVTGAPGERRLAYFPDPDATCSNWSTARSHWGARAHRQHQGSQIRARILREEAAGRFVE